MIIGNLLAGRPCEVYGIRPVAFAGLVFTLVGLIGASFCNSIPALIATQGEPSLLQKSQDSNVFPD